jgi:glycosyltransferase involved in cell wall biosynthesis
MRYRIAVLHQGFIPIYRERFFELLNSSTHNEYVVFHGDPPRRSGHLGLPGPFAFPNVKVRNHELAIGRSALIYQPVLRAILRGQFDALVVGHEVKFVTSMMLFAAFKALGRPALLWGHGLHRTNATWLARAGSGPLARLADAYLVYTAAGKSLLEPAGVGCERIFIVRNTLDVATQQEAKRRLEDTTCDALKDSLGIRRDARVLLYIGRLVRHKAVDVLIECMRRWRADASLMPIELLIAGDGPERTALERQAADLSNIRFLGNVYEPDQVAKLMKVAVAVILPGTVGLAVNHAFAFGRPVVTRESTLHPPEIEYIEPGRNGLIAPADIEGFVGAVSDLLKDEAQQERLAAGALVTGETLTLDYSVAQFDAGVRYAIVMRRAKSAPRNRYGARANRRP